SPVAWRATSTASCFSREPARCLQGRAAAGASYWPAGRRSPLRVPGTSWLVSSPGCSARIPMLSRPPEPRPGSTLPPASAGPLPIRCSVASRRPRWWTKSRSRSMKSPDSAKRLRRDYRAAVARLRNEARAAAGTSILALFDAEADRLARLSFDVAGLHIDLSRQRLPSAACDALGEVVEASGLAERRAAMFAGESVNATEGRAAFHVALRAPAGTPRRLGADGPEVAAEVDGTLAR